MIPVPSVSPDRERELRAGLSAVRERIAAACAASGRDPDGLRLVVVTKTRPAADVAALVSMGVTDTGENRDQEAAAKAAELADLPLTWHFVGQVQTNKVRGVVRYASCLHSVDRPELVDALARALVDGRRPSGCLPRLEGQPVRCLLQVSLDGDPHRGGVVPAELVPLAERVAEVGGLSLAGIMAVAPLGTEPRRAFSALPELSAAVRAIDPGATWVSAGMSGDLEAAIEAGATHLRVGSAVLGRRAPLG